MGLFSNTPVHLGKFPRGIISDDVDLKTALTELEAASNVLTQIVTTTSDFEKTDDTTLEDIPELSLTVKAGRTYRFKGILFTNCPQSRGIKVALNGTCTASSMRYKIDVQGDLGNVVQIKRSGSLGTEVSQTGVSNPVVTAEGTITVNTAGTFLIQFAQASTAVFGTSKVYAGSFFEVSLI